MINLSLVSTDKQRKMAVVLTYANVIISAYISLFYTPFLLRMLGQSEFGLYSLATSVIGYLEILDLGFGNAVIVFTSKYITQNRKEDENKLHGTIFTIYLIMSVIIIILGTLIVIFADTIFGQKMTPREISELKIMFGLLTFNLAVSFPFSIFPSILTAYENFIFIKIVAIFRTLMLPAMMIPVLFMGYKSVSFVVVVTIINITCLIVDFWYCKKNISPNVSVKNFDFKLLKEIFSYSFFIFLGAIVDQVNWSVDNFILGAVVGSVAVSIYSVAIIINNMFIVLSVTISGVMLPKISKMVSQNSSNEELTDEFIKVGRIQFYIIFLISSCLVLFGQEFINFWVGPNYAQSYTIALILVIPVSIPLVQNLGLSILQAKNMYKFRAIMEFALTFVNVGISIPLAKLYGGIGCAIGTAFVLIVLNVLIMNYYYHFKVGLNIIKFWKNILKMSLKFGVAVMAILAISHYFPLNGVKFLFIFGLLYIAMYTFISWKFVMNEYEKAIILSVIAKLRRKK